MLKAAALTSEMSVHITSALPGCTDKRWLLAIRDKARDFLLRRLELRLHEGKSVIVDSNRGVEFLGAFIKPRLTYISRSSLKRMQRHVEEMESACRRGAVDGPHEARTSLCEIWQICGRCLCGLCR